MSQPRPLPSFWVLNLWGWAAFGVGMFVVRVLIHVEPFRALGITLMQEPTAILLSWLLYLAYRRIDPGRRFRVQTAAWMVSLSFAAAIVQACVAMTGITYLGWEHQTWSPLEEWLLRILFYLVVFLSWSLTYYWIRAERTAEVHEVRASEAEHEAGRLELELLRGQLDPHFVFNALNGIASLIPGRADDAVAMVRELADYLRYSLEHRHESLVSLEQEIRVLANYLEIERVRFGDRLKVRIEADAASRRAEVPSFLLQPLAENAVKHCFRHDRPPWNLEFRATSRGNSLALELRNSGRLENGDADGFGLGLETLRRRLEIHYPDAHRITLREEGDSVVAGIELEGRPRCA